MTADDTRKWTDFYFEILGERGNKYSALEGVWKFYDIQRAIDSGDRQAARDLADVLQEVGLQYVVDKAVFVTIIEECSWVWNLTPGKTGRGSASRI